MDVLLDWWWWIIWKKKQQYLDVSNGIKKELYCESIYNKTFLKTKIKSYFDESTDFHDNEVPKAG